MEKSLYEKLGGSYTKVGDYLLPNLMIDENEQRPNNALSANMAACANAI